MPINNKIKSLYDAMRADGADVGTAEEFNDWFLRPGSEGYNNRKRVYDAFKADGADVGKNYEEFRDWLGMQPKSSVQKQTQQPKTEEPTLPNLSQLAGKEPVKTTPYTAQQDNTFVSFPMGVGAKIPENLLEDKLKNKAEERVLDKTYTPKEAKSASDVARNYADRFKLTKHGEQLSNELADTEKKITDKYATQFQQVPEFQDLLKKYKGDELNERAGELFQQMYGKNIEEEMKPYNEAYYKAMNDRYGNDIEREQAQFLKKEVGAQVERQSKDIEARLRNYDGGFGVYDPGGYLPKTPESGWTNKREIGMLNAAKRLNRESANMIAEAAKTGHTNVVAAVGRGVRDTAFNPETWSFGIVDLLDNKNLKEVLDKADKGKRLTEDEQLLLDACVTNMATQAYYSSDLSLAYKAGQATGASLPFMLEFAVNPVAASGSSIAKSILRYGIKKFGKAAVKKSMAKMGARLVGDAAAAAMMTGTTGLGNVAAGTLDREIGRVTFDTADDGKVLYNGREGQQDFGTAVAKSFATQFLENQSEMVFNAFKGTGGVLLDRLEKAAPGLANRIKNMSAPQFYKDIMSNPTLVEVAKRTQFHGLPEEYLEEVYNNFANVPLGEMTMEEATDLDQNIETFVSLIPTTVGFAALGLGGLGAQRFKSYRHRKQMEQHLTPEDLQRIDGLQNDNDVVEYIKEVTRNSILNAETKKWMIQAASERAATIAQEQLRQEQTPEQNAADDAYAGGAEQDHAGNYQTERNRASLSEELETKAPGLAANIEEMVENEASAGEMRSLFGSLERDVVKTAEAYYHALLSEKGAMDNAQAQVDEAASRFEKGLASVTDTEGNVTTATYKDEAVYVISQEGDNATIQRADGSREVVFAKHLQGTQTTPAQTLADNKRKQLAGQSRQDMGNRFSNHPNTQEPKEGMQLWNGEAPYIITGIRNNADGTQTITAFPAVLDNKSGQMVAKQGSTPIEMSHDEAMQLQNDYYNRMDESNGNAEAETETAPTEEQTEEPQTTASENASTEETGQTKKKVRGRKQVQKAFAALQDAYAKKDYVACLNAINAINQNVRLGDEGAITDEEQAFADKVKEETYKQGYEVSELEGKPYNEGMRVNADFVNDESLPPGTMVIRIVKKPQILKDGELVQKATLLVAQNLTEGESNSSNAKSANQKFDRTVPATIEEQKDAISRIVEFAKKVKDKVERAVIGGITAKQAKDFKENGIEGINDTWVHSFESSAVTHNQKQHGESKAKEEENRNQIPITEEDYERIPDILNDYDKVYKSANKNNRSQNDVIVYEKDFGDGIVYYLEERRDNRKSLSFQTMYKKKKGTDSSDGTMHKAPTLTSKSASDNLSSTDKDSNSSETMQAEEENSQTSAKESKENFQEIEYDFSDTEPMNDLELAAMVLGNGGIKLLQSSFIAETGFGRSEVKKYIGLFAKKEKGGMSIERAGELLMQQDREEGTNFFDQDDPNAGRNAIIEVLSKSRTKGELRKFISENRKAWVKRNREAEYAAYERWCMEYLHMTPDEYEAYKAYEENYLPLWLEEMSRIPEEVIERFILEFGEYDNRRANTGSVEDMQGEQPASSERTESDLYGREEEAAGESVDAGRPVQEEQEQVGDSGTSGKPTLADAVAEYYKKYREGVRSHLDALDAVQRKARTEGRDITKEELDACRELEAKPLRDLAVYLRSLSDEELAVGALDGIRKISHHIGAAEIKDVWSREAAKRNLSEERINDLRGVSQKSEVKNNSAGVFSKRYGNKKKTIWSASEVQNDNSAAVGDGLQSEPIAENGSTSNGTPSKSSGSKVTEKSSEKQENGGEIAERVSDFHRQIADGGKSYLQASKAVREKAKAEHRSVTDKEIRDYVELLEKPERDFAKYLQTLSDEELVVDAVNGVKSLPHTLQRMRMQGVVRQEAARRRLTQELVDKLQRKAKRQAEEVDENGHPFARSSDGTTTFGYIEADSGLTLAPIKLSEGFNKKDEKGNNIGYGKEHINEGHGKQIRDAGYDSIEDFVEYVARNYKEIRIGRNRKSNQTYMLLELHDEKHNATLYVELSRNGEYWNVNSGGVFKKKYTDKNDIVWPLPTVGSDTSTDTAEVAGSPAKAENGETADRGGNSSQPISSVGKDSDSSETMQAEEENSQSERRTASAPVRQTLSEKKRKATEKVAEQSVNYLNWSEEKAQNGEPFLIGEGSNIDLVDIPQEVFAKIGIKQMPFRLTPSMVNHVLQRHAKELKLANAQDAVNAILDVMRNFDHVRQGRDNTFVFTIEEGKNKAARRAITLVLEYDNGEWLGIKTVGYDRVGNLQELPVLWEKSENKPSATAATSVNVPSEQSSQGGQTDGIASNQSKGNPSAGKGSEVSDTEQGKGGKTAKKSSAVKDEKIDDYGEKIAGARKDMLREIAKSLGNATLESFITLPFAKAFKRPNLKKAVETGVLRDGDARFAEAVMAAYLSQGKPKELKRSSWAMHQSKQTIQQWAERCVEGVDMLKKLFDMDEAARDAYINEIRNRKTYDEDDIRLHKEQLREWNPGHKFEGTCYGLNPIAVFTEVYSRLGYDSIGEVKLPITAVAPTNLYDGYQLKGANGKQFWPEHTLVSFEDVVEEIVYQTKKRNGDADTDHPTGAFHVRGIEPTKEITGYNVRCYSSLSASYPNEEKAFPTKEEAEKYAKEYMGGKKGRLAYVDTKTKITGYKEYEVQYKYEYGVDNASYDYWSIGTKYDTEEEARAAITERHDELNEKVNARIAAELDKKGEKREKKDFVDVMIYSEDGFRTTKYAVVLSDKYAPKKTAFNTMPFTLKNGFSTRKEAEEYIERHRTEWEERIANIDRQRKEFVYFGGNSNERTGEDYRKGQDVTAEQFVAQFGFRGVQFGNWANQRDRQAALNNAFDSFMDLAKVLGISPRALSLNGELGIAFGARGSGGAMAHYERSEVVINLTKTQGAGSLAHEWWHALDNYFARQGGVAMGNTTENRGFAMRDELRKAFNSLVNNLYDSDYHLRSKERGYAYWGTTREETARMFEKWVKSELESRGENNDFLTAVDMDAEKRWAEMNYRFYKWGVENNDKEPMGFEEFKKTPMALNGFVYPSREELETFGAKLRNIFDTIQERVDAETGKTIMYHRGNVVNAPSQQEAVLCAVLGEALNKKNGITVITDVEEGQRVLDMLGSEARLQAALGSLAKAANTIRGWLEKGTRNKSFVLELPLVVRQEIRRKLGRDFDSHEINSNNVAHAYKNHGEGGIKLGENSIPLRKEDMELMPYIMTAPTRIERGSTDATGRESVRFIKELSNGVVIVVEKEQKNSPDDMETITMWAELPSSNVADARSRRTSPAIDVRNVTISTEDAAKIRRDAETAIENDRKIREQRVFHGSGADFEAFDHSHMGEGEGAQAYGWGTYVTEVKGIGISYADQMRNRITYKGYTWKELFDNHDMPGYMACIDIIEWLERGYSFDEAVEIVKRDYEEILVPSDELSEEQNREFTKEYEELLAFLPEINEHDFEINRERHLYTVEIPDETEAFYLDHTQRMSEQQDILDMADNALTHSGWRRVEVDGMVRLTKGDKTIVLNPRGTGADLYNELSDALGSPKAASEFLHEVGVVGIKYPAQYQSGGRDDGAKNYVIFNEKDAKIVDHIRYFRTPNGEAYGFTVGGKIYIDPRIATAETPIHEYTHLWATALRNGNPKEWKNVVKLMKGTSVWNEVKKNYPELETEDEIADEVLAHYSGRRGAERLREEQRKLSEGKDVLAAAEAITAMERVRKALDKFWKAVADFLHIHYTSAEEVADRVMSDLLNGVNPNEFVSESDKRVREQFIGEIGAANMDKAEEATTRLDNLAVAREMEDAKKDAKAIKMATGWERGADGMWRYETDDVMISPAELGERILDGKATTLADFIGKDTPLLKAYPELKDVKVQLVIESEKDVKGLGSYNVGKKTIQISTRGMHKEYIDNLIKLQDDDARLANETSERVRAMLNEWVERDRKNMNDVASGIAEKLRSTLNHEIQHAIQHIEGFAKGGNLRKAYMLRELADALTADQHQFIAEVERYDEVKNTMRPGYTLVRYLNDISGVFDSDFARGLYGMTAEDLREEYARLKEKEKKSGKLASSDIYDIYRAFGGEVEARNVQARLNMPPEERRNSLASETEDVAREDQIFLNDALGESALIGDPADTFRERQKRAVEQKGVVTPGLNEAEVEVVNVPKHRYTGDIAQATRQAIDAATEKYAPNETPRTLHYDNHGQKFDYTISGNSIAESLNPKQQGKSVNKGVHLALAEHMDEVINNSIEVEEHPDYQKDEQGERNTAKVNNEALMHRFYGAVNIDGQIYRVMTLMREDYGSPVKKGVRAYEVQTIEVLNEESPSTSNGEGSIEQERSIYPLAKLLQGVEKSYDTGKKLLDESENSSELDKKSAAIAEEVERIVAKAKADGTYMKAPNGKPSNLSKHQWVQVRTKAFKEWFGDWENNGEDFAVNLDENGEPKVFYHNTPNKFTIFDAKRNGTQNDAGWLGDGFYFYGDENEGNGYGKNKMSVYLKLENPYFATSEDAERLAEANSREGSIAFREQLEEDGYDGVYYNGDLRQEVVVFEPNQIKSAEYNNGEFSRDNNDIRFRDTASLDAVNEQFNGELSTLTEENADSVTLSLGTPSDILQSAGVENKPMKLYGNKVMKKMRKHGFTLDELRDLPKAVANPIAVFNNYQKNGSRSILTELKTEQGNFLVTLTIGKGEDLDFNIVSSVFGKGKDNIVDWFERGFATYIDKEKALNYLHHSALLAVTLDSSRLSSATNVVRNFENPNIFSENIRELDEKSAAIAEEVERMGNELAPVRVVRSEADLTDEERTMLQNRRREAVLRGTESNVKGWFDPKTGEVVVYLPNAESVDDARRTFLHEVVGHKGLRELIGRDKFDAAMEELYGLLPESERKKVDAKGGSRAAAMDEYLAEQAEKDEKPTWWDRVTSVIRKMLRKAGLSVELTDGEVRYLLWRSRENIQRNNALAVAEDIHMRETSGIGDIRFRDVASPNSPSPSDTAEAWDKLANSTAFLMRETTVDYLTAVEKFQDLIAKKTHSRVLDSENAYYAFLALTSKSRQEMDAFEAVFLGPLSEALSRFVDRSDRKPARLRLWGETSIPRPFAKEVDWDKGQARELVMYVTAKHGMERNLDMAVQKYLESVADANGRFDKELDDFKKKQHRGLMHLGAPSPILQSCGVNVKEITLSPKVLNKKLNQHGLTADDVKGLVDAIRKPILVYRHGENSPNIVVVTEQEVKGNKLSIALELNEQGEVVELNNVSSVHDKDAATEVERLTRLTAEELRNGLRWVENEKVSDWLGAVGLDRPMHTELGQKPVSLANVLNEFENPSVSDGNKSKTDEAQREQLRQDWENERERIKAQNISWEDQQDQLRDYAEQQMGVDTSEDYSGLSEMFGDPILYPNGWQAEARSYMEAYEQSHDADDIDALWNAIGNATQFALEKQLQSGLVSQEYVDRQRKRFDYYIPLRGFADETAGDVYQYIQNEYYPGGNPVKTAKGRTSEAGNPFGSILQIAYSSISSGNKNLAKQALYRFVKNHDTGGLINVNKAVAIKFNEASAKYPNLFKQPEQGAQPSEWVEAVPIIPEDATREEIAQIMDEFDKAIADLKKAGEAEDIGRRSKIAYRTLGKERNEHQITVFLGGNKHVITITGNPRLAQAANGLLNPDTSDDSLSQMAKRVQRGMAGMLTSKSAAFSLANLFRDTEYANNQAFINENMAYWALFTYHQRLGFGKLPQLTKLLLQYRRGTLDLSDKSAQQFKEFLDNGGATGYTFVENQNEYALQIAEDMNQLIKRKNLGKKGWDAVWNAIEFAGNVAELVNRFAAYQASREVGRSVARSIIDAKEISTNFNRKGAGRKTADTTKDRGILDPVHITAALSQYGRTMIIFWNAGIQSKYRFYKNLKEHPIKTVTTQIGGCMALSAVLVPLWNNMVAPALFSVFGMGSDDDDSDYYDTLTDYERRNYLCLRAPKGYWIKIPLTPELKPWYAMGDCIGAAVAGKRDIEARDVWENVGDAISPASVNWNYKGGQFAINAMPTVAQPLFQHGMNVNFMGSTIRKEKAFGSGQYDPEYTKVSRRTSPVLVGASKAWNQFLMGSDGDIKTAGTFDFNPAVLQNYITGYTGGFGQTFILAADMIKAWANGESTPLTMSRSPLSGRFVISGNKEVQLDRIDMGYYDVKDFINQIDHDEKALKKKVKDSAKDPVEYAGYKRRLEELMRSDDYRKAKTLEYYDDGIKKYQKYLESDPDNVTAREAMYAAKRQAIEMLRQR